LGPLGGLHGLHVVVGVGGLEGAGLHIVDVQSLRVAHGLRVAGGLLLRVGGHLRPRRGTHVVAEVVAGGVVDVVGADDWCGLRPLRGGDEGTRFVVGRRRQRQILARGRVHRALLVAVARR